MTIWECVKCQPNTQSHSFTISNRHPASSIETRTARLEYAVAPAEGEGGTETDDLIESSIITDLTDCNARPNSSERVSERLVESEWPLAVRDRSITVRDWNNTPLMENVVGLPIDPVQCSPVNGLSLRSSIRWCCRGRGIHCELPNDEQAHLCRDIDVSGY